MNEMTPFPNIVPPEDVIDQPRREIPRKTALEALLEVDESLGATIVNDWGSQRIHDDMHSLLFGTNTKLKQAAKVPLMHLYMRHADLFGLLPTKDAFVARDTWWHEAT